MRRCADEDFGAAVVAHHKHDGGELARLSGDHQRLGCCAGS
jgi:hypothetical protein